MLLDRFKFFLSLPFGFITVPKALIFLFYCFFFADNILLIIWVDKKLFVIVYTNILIYKCGIGFPIFSKKQAFFSKIGKNFISFQPLSANKNIINYIQNYKKFIKNNTFLDYKISLNNNIYNL